MNDPVKNFINEHREEFDHLEPSPEILQNIKRNLNLINRKKKHIRIARLAKWGVAASILIICSINIYYFNRNNKSINQLAIRRDMTTDIEVPKLTEPQELINRDSSNIKKISPPLAVLETKRKLIQQNISKDDSYQQEIHSILMLLSEGQSSSNRVLALVKAKHLSHIDDNLLKTLAETITQDENSNVRLAALEVILSRINESKVEEILIETFVEQDDPILQSELIDILSQIDGIIKSQEVKDKLIDLTEDSATLNFVKDRAYTALIDY